MGRGDISLQPVQRGSRGHEFEQSSDENAISIVGRLRTHYDFWKSELQASSFVLQIIKHGYYIPFLEMPSSFIERNNRSSLNNKQFVEEAIDALLLKGCVEELAAPAFCCNPLTVAEKNQKLRLVLDLRQINEKIKITKFRYEDLTTFAETFDKNDYFFKFDFKSGYHHIDILPEHQKYLGFAWEYSNGITRYFKFVVLPFGLASACYVFTKVVRPLVTKWRSLGIKSIVYIDDGINGQGSFDNTKTAARIVKSDIEKSGFVINMTKSDFEPKQVGEWLGTNIDTKSMKFSVPIRKIKGIKACIKSILVDSTCTVKQLSKVTGLLSSMHLSIGPLVRLFTRYLYRTIENRNTWFDFIHIDSETRFELQFWYDNIEQRNGYTFKPCPSYTNIVFTDASDTGYGGFYCNRLGKVLCTGKFSNLEKTTSSTSRELLAIKFVLESFEKILTNESVTVHVDNINAARILSVGSSKVHLQNICLDIFQFCLRKNIKFIAQWVPREYNRQADALSRINDTDDWSIDHSSFMMISSRYGPFTIDRFADNRNKKIERFNSKFYCPGTLAVDCFTENWNFENNWICPPVKLICYALRHLKLCQANGTVIIPMWKSSYFWPTIYPNGVTLASFIKEFTVFDPYFISESNSVFSGYANFRCMALNVEF